MAFFLLSAMGVRGPEFRNIVIREFQNPACRIGLAIDPRARVIDLGPSSVNREGEFPAPTKVPAGEFVNTSETPFPEKS
jgi:hypothetical protein